VIEPDGTDREIGPSGFRGRYDLCLFANGDATWAFFLASRDWHWPPYTLFRVNAETGEFAEMPMPENVPAPFDGDVHLSAQSPDVVLVAETGEVYRTHRADFSSRSWGRSIEGSFEVIDEQGTLLERRSDSWLAKTRDGYDTCITVIRNGVRDTVDLRLPGLAVPVFGTGYVRLYDGRHVVFRSLEGRPDLQVPERPAAHEGPAEILPEPRR